jgi:hypothetical protein
MLQASTYFNRKSDLGEMGGRAVFGDGKRSFYFIDWSLCDDCDAPTIVHRAKAQVQGHASTVIKAPEEWIRQGFAEGDWCEALPANAEAWAFEPGPEAEYEEGFLCVECQAMAKGRKGGE